MCGQKWRAASKAGRHAVSAILRTCHLYSRFHADKDDYNSALTEKHCEIMVFLLWLSYTYNDENKSFRLVSGRQCKMSTVHNMFIVGFRIICPVRYLNITPGTIVTCARMCPPTPHYGVA